MKILSKSFPKRKSVTFICIIIAILFFFLFSYIAYYLDYFFLNYKRFTVIDYIEISCWIIFGFLIGSFIILYFIDRVLWELKGEEFILYDSDFLYIVNKGRIFGKIKKISWNSIADADMIKLSLYEQIIVYFSVSGEIDERIQITRHKRPKIYCGLNLSEDVCEEIVSTIRKMVNLRISLKTEDYST